ATDWHHSTYSPFIINDVEVSYPARRRVCSDRGQCIANGLVDMQLGEFRPHVAGNWIIESSLNVRGKHERPFRSFGGNTMAASVTNMFGHRLQAVRIMRVRYRRWP